MLGPSRMTSLLLPARPAPPTLDATGMGIGAGAVMLAALAFASLAHGDAASLPLHYTASLMLGSSAITSTAFWFLFAGSLVNIGISALYGRLYSRVVSFVPPTVGESWAGTVATGLLFGAFTYVLGIQLVSRALFPWMLEANQLSWFAAHAFVFGPVLAVMYEVGQRRERARLA